MRTQDWKVDHIACRELEQAIKDYELLGFQKCHKQIHDGQVQKVRVQFMHLGETVIELLEPQDKADEHNPLSSYLATPGYKMYHLCYEVDDFDEAVSYLRKNNYRQLGKIFSDSTHNARRLVFMYHRRGGGESNSRKSSSARMMFKTLFHRDSNVHLRHYAD